MNGRKTWLSPLCCWANKLNLSHFLPRDGRRILPCTSACWVFTGRFSSTCWFSSKYAIGDQFRCLLEVTFLFQVLESNKSDECSPRDPTVRWIWHFPNNLCTGLGVVWVRRGKGGALSGVQIWMLCFRRLLLGFGTFVTNFPIFVML